MKIVYDDLVEFAEIVLRCSNTVKNGRCMWCPFFDRCEVDRLDSRHVTCGEIEHSREGEA